jgi:hypothetical protein
MRLTGAASVVQVHLEVNSDTARKVFDFEFKSGKIREALRLARCVNQDES